MTSFMIGILPEEFFEELASCLVSFRYSEINSLVAD
jgi:hypothetical protein